MICPILYLSFFKKDYLIYWFFGALLLCVAGVFYHCGGQWGEKYPIVINSWKNNWNELSAYFEYSEPIRRIIYTTNTIEGFNRQIRKITKTKGGFNDDDSLKRLVYLIYKDISKKWKKSISN